MFDHLIDENKPELEKVEDWQVLSKAQDFIKELIVGKPADAEQPGSYKEKSFLFDIVSNKRNGIDVDKFDYFARDCHHLGIKNSFDHHRFMKFARVCEVEGKMQICVRDKEVGNLYDLFHARNSLHRRAYQHNVTNIVETMITEAFVLADIHLTFKGKVNQDVKMSEAIDDMVAYTKLTDNVFEKILFSTSTELDGAREILMNIVHRRLYKCVGQFYSAEELLEDAKSEIRSTLAGDTPSQGNFIVNEIPMDYGMEGKNPIDQVSFYGKGELDQTFQIPSGRVSKLLPEHFQEFLIQVYCKRADEESLRTARERLRVWCETKVIIYCLHFIAPCGSIFTNLIVLLLGSYVWS
ncbi:unnamed protein product [Arctogadus glacialis]